MKISSYIDHTMLKPSATLEDIQRLCSEAREYEFAAVCVPPYFVSTAKELLEGTEVKVATVIGFPFGYNHTDAKLKEVEQALGEGADELDVVHNIIALRNGNYLYLQNEAKQCTDMVHAAGKKIKVIIESGILSKDEIAKCCELYAPLGVDYLKTSSGYADAGATVEAVEIMRANLPESIGIKASGGIGSYAAAKELIEAGATRLGCSGSVQIMNESIAITE